MLAFIKSIPDVVNRMLMHIESPPFVDLLFRIIQLDDNPGNIGVMDVSWFLRAGLHIFIIFG
jgi:serine/threonine-protein phosphatase 6 regulatory subunit 3